MSRRFWLITLVLALAAPGAARAQTAGTPPVELGLGVTFGNEHLWDRVAARATPIFTVNFDPWSAAEAEFGRASSPDRQRRATVAQVRFKRAVHEYGPGRVVATLGFAVRHEVADITPPIGTTGPRGNETFRIRSTEWAPVVGLGVEQVVAPRLRLRAEARLTLGADIGLASGLVGATIPVGRYTQPLAGATGEALPPAHPLASLRHGRRIWITTRDGRVLAGRWGQARTSGVAFWQDEALSELAMSEVARVETTDRLREGLIYGSTIGAAAGAVFGVAAVRALCDFDCPGVVPGTAGLGALIGLAIGVTSDSLRIRRRTVFDAGRGANRFELAPVVGTTERGVRGVIWW